MTDEPAFPDLYADGANVAIGPFGLVLTYSLANPDAPADPPRKLVRVRMTKELGLTIARMVTRLVDAAPQSVPEWEEVKGDA